MEGMISKETIELQKDVVNLGRCIVLLDKLARGLVVWLLEIPHGQWLYTNTHVHDTTEEMEASTRK